MADGEQQQQRILQKLVHASERQWARLVIPGKQVPHFTAMQAELKALGQDISIFVRDAPPGTRTWRWMCRMTVQVGRAPTQLRLGGWVGGSMAARRCARSSTGVWEPSSYQNPETASSSAPAPTMQRPMILLHPSTASALASTHLGPAPTLQRPMILDLGSFYEVT